MGLYRDQVIPRVVNIACSAKSARSLRGRVCAGLQGEVLEIGFGTGLNLPFCPPLGPSDRRSVLRPGAPIHFVEHGLAEDEHVRRLQQQIDRVHASVAGCHVNRPIVELLTNAGFVTTELDVFYQRGAPKFAGAVSLGVGLAA